MKITEEWIKKEISLCEKNIEFCKKKGWENLTERYEWQLGVWRHILFRKIESGHTMHIFRQSVSKWRRNVIKFLERVIDRLEGVEDFNDSNPFKKIRTSK